MQEGKINLRKSNGDKIGSITVRFAGEFPEEVIKLLLEYLEQAVVKWEEHFIASGRTVNLKK